MLDDDCERRVTFPDGLSLDAEAAAAILRPYPELLEQWQAQLYDEFPGLPPVRCKDPMIYSPTYLRAVISEYLLLRNGGDRVDPGLAARCEQIAAVRSEVVEERRSYLSNPWRRAQSAEMLGYRPLTVADCYDPEYLQSRVDYFTRREDPFDEVGIQERLVDAKWNTRTLKEADAPWN